MALVNRIKELAQKYGYTLKTLEESAELGNGTIRRWDDSPPSIKNLYKVANLLNCSCDYLWIGEGAQAASSQFIGLSSDEEELIKLFRQMPQKEQYKLMGRMEEKIESLHDGAEDPVAAGNLLQAK